MPPCLLDICLPPSSGTPKLCWRARGGGRGRKAVACRDLSWAVTVFQTFLDFSRLQFFSRSKSVQETWTPDAAQRTKESLRKGCR